MMQGYLYMIQRGWAHETELFLRRTYLRGLLVLNTPLLFETLFRDPVYSGLLGTWVNRLQLKPERRILEVGCASGGFAVRLAARGHRVTALDRSRRMIEFARRLHGHEPVRFLCGELDSPELPAHSYDGLLGASILNIVDDPPVFLDQVRRLLAADGRVSFLFPTPGFTTEALAEHARQSRLSRPSHAILTLWQARASRLCPEDVLDWLSQAGFVDADVEIFMDGMVAAVSARVPIRVSFPLPKGEGTDP